MGISGGGPAVGVGGRRRGRRGRCRRGHRVVVVQLMLEVARLVAVAVPHRQVRVLQVRPRRGHGRSRGRGGQRNAQRAGDHGHQRRPAGNGEKHADNGRKHDQRHHFRLA